MDRLYKDEFCIARSKSETEKLSVGCFKNTKLIIQGHKCLSNWAVGDVRLDVILGMLWHVQWDEETG